MAEDDGGREIIVKPENLERVCSGCSGVFEKLLACSRCKAAYFCTQACLRASWKSHKAVCARSRPSSADAPAQASRASSHSEELSLGGRDQLVEKVHRVTTHILTLKKDGDDRGVVALQQQALWAIGHLTDVYEDAVLGGYLTQSRCVTNHESIAQDICQTYSILGNSYRNLRQSKQAIKIFEAALNFCSARAIKLDVCAMMSLATAYLDTHDHPKALAMLERARNTYTARGDRLGECNVLTTLGAVYADMNQHRQALTHYLRNAELAEELGASNEAWMAMTNLCAVNCELGDLQAALAAAERAQALHNKLRGRDRRDLTERARAFCNMSALYHMLDRNDEAKALAQKALNIAEDDNNAQGMYSAHNILGCLELNGEAGQGCETAKQAKAALRCYARALEARNGPPGADDVVLYTNIAGAHSFLQQDDDALEALATARSLVPKGSHAEAQVALQMATMSYTKGGAGREGKALKFLEHWRDTTVTLCATMCAFCQQHRRDDDARLLTCGQCSVCRYCCPEHQKEHWKLPRKPSGAGLLANNANRVSHKSSCILLKNWRLARKGRVTREACLPDMLKFLQEQCEPAHTDAQARSGK